MPTPPAANLALLSPVPPPVLMAQGPIWGSDMVTVQFLRALLRYGRFERYLFFGADVEGGLAARRMLQGIWPGAERIEVHHLLDLPEVLAETSVLALHTAASHLYHGVAARNAVPDGRFPVTASAFQSPTFHGALPMFASDLLCGTRAGDTVLAMSEAMAEVLRRRYQALRTGALAPWQGALREPDVVAMPLGIDVEQYRPRVPSDWRQKLSIPPHAFVVLSLGRLSPTDKGDWQPVLRGFRDFLAQEGEGRPTYLVIAGSEYVGYRSTLQRWSQELGLSERVRLVPSPPEAEKAALLGAADCFLALPDNPQEAFGYSVLEAMACGLPVVAADWDGLKETVSDDVGLRAPTVWGPALERLEQLTPAYWYTEWSLMSLVAAQSVAVDVAAAWRHVATLRENPPLGWELGANARDKAVSHYAWPVVIARHEALWQEAAERAATAQPETAPTLQWAMDFSTAFGHYPTTWLGPETRLQRVAADSPPVFDSPYATIARLLQPDLLQTLYDRLADAQPVSALLDAHARADLVYYHLLWLLKQGYVQRCPEAPGAGAGDDATG